MMWCHTAFGGYPHCLPHTYSETLKLPGDSPNTFNEDVGFTSWILLNYKKPVQVSSMLGKFHANNANDKTIKVK